jgi:photosystem II stability/assembly factor-like uncharacterized protein
MYNFHKYLFVFFFCVAFNTLNAQWQQTNFPFTGAQINGIVSYDSTILSITNCGYYSRNDDVQPWNLDSSFTFSVYDQQGDSLYFLSGSNLMQMSISNSTIPATHLGSISANVLAHTDSCLFSNGFGFSKSSDHGATWSIHNDGLPGDSTWYHGQFCCVLYQVPSIDATSNYIFAGTGRGVYRNSANLVTWMPVNNGIPAGYISQLKSFQDTLYAVSGYVLYKSSDFGNSWDSLFASPSIVTSLLIHNSDSIYLGTAENGFYFSGNGGTSWNAINNGLADTSVKVIAYHNSTLYCGTSQQGIFKFDGNQWVDENAGINCSDIYSLIVVDSSLVATGTKNVFISDDHNNWTNISPSISYYNLNKVKATGDTILISATDHFPNYPYRETHLLYSADKGATWNNLNDPPITYDDGTYRLINAYQGRIFAGAGDQIFYTDDFGQTWIDISFTESACYITDLFIDDSIIMAGSCYPAPVRKLNNAQQWVSINSGLPQDDVYSFAKFQDTYFTGFSYSFGAVYKSNDYGGNWSYAGNGLTSNEGFHDYVSYAQRLLISTEKGIFATRDTGESWHLIDHKGLKTFSIGPMVIFNDTLYAGTQYSNVSQSSGHGVWKFALDSLHIGIDEYPSHSFAELHPNPFSSNATLFFDRTLNNASIRIYNTVGQQVKEIKNVSGSQVKILRGQLKAGMFFLIVDIDGSVIATTRFIIAD